MHLPAGLRVPFGRLDARPLRPTIATSGAWLALRSQQAGLTGQTHMRLAFAVISMVSLNALAQQPPCKTHAQEQAILASIRVHLNTLEQTVKSVPPEEAQYLAAEMADTDNLPRVAAATERPLSTAWAIRKHMKSLQMRLADVDQANSPASHVLALIDLRDVNRDLWQSVAGALLDAQGSASSTFYSVQQSSRKVAAAVRYLLDANRALRECVPYAVSESRSKAGQKQM